MWTKIVPIPNQSPTTQLHPRRPSSPLSASAVIVRRPPSPSAAHRYYPCHPPPSKSSAAGPPSLFDATVCHVHVLYPQGWRYRQNICLGPLAPPFHFLTQNASIQFQGNPFSSDQSHANVLVVSRVAAVQGLFSPRYFRSLERKFTLGSFAPKNESSGELSLPGVKVPGNFCSREWMFPGTFVPRSDILGSELYV